VFHPVSQGQRPQLHQNFAAFVPKSQVITTSGAPGLLITIFGLMPSDYSDSQDGIYSATMPSVGAQEDPSGKEALVATMGAVTSGDTSNLYFDPIPSNTA
jgi:hypothetical protein